MEDKVYKNNFEQFLKDTTDDFLMVPSRKVWYSIYNDMHPDRKWPSIAVCMLILSAVMYIGVSNNNSLSSAARSSAAENLSGIVSNYASEKTVDMLRPVTAAIQNKALSFSTIYPQQPGLKNNIQELPADNTQANQIFNPSDADPKTNIAGVQANETISKMEFPSLSALVTSDNSRPSPGKEELISSEKKHITQPDILPDPKIAPSSVVIDNGKNISLSPAITPEIDINNNDVKLHTDENGEMKHTVDNERPWKEDYAFRNKPAMNKFMQNAGITYYITPSAGYRSFFKNRDHSMPPASSSLIATTNRARNNELIDGIALNLEAGAAIHYKVSENFRLKSGLQANYTNYTSNVTELGHPTLTALAVKDGYNAIRSSLYSTNPGSDKLNKATLQVALPMGADLKIAGNNKIKWYVGAAIQPTYIVGGSSYLLSADANYYISARDLLRKWNMNTAVETFISFKPSSGVTLNLGPQFRYQLLSTYKTQYNYTEKLYNLGIKIGVTTGF